MSDPIRTDVSRTLEPVHTDDEVRAHRWTKRLVLFLRIMAVLSLLKGLWHWAQVTGIVGAADGGFENHPLSWQAATVFFAVIDLVAGVALWLGSTWGAMMWLIAAVLQLFADVVVLAPSGFLVLLTIVETLLVATYVILRFMVHAESDRKR